VTTTHSAATFEDILGEMQDGNTVSVSGGATYTFNEASDNFDFTNNSGAIASSGDGTTFAENQGLIPTTGTLTGTYQVSGAGTAIFEVDNSGNILIEGEEAYLSATNELTANSGAGASGPVTIGDLFNTATSGGYSIALGGTTYSGSGGTSVDYADTATSDAVEAALDGTTTSTISLGDGLSSWDVTYSGGATAASTNTFVDADGDLTEVETFTTEYNINAETGEVTVAGSRNIEDQAGAAVTGSEYEPEVGATVYVSGGALTTDETTPGEATEDPLATLDSAIANVDSLRSELGAVQNRFADAIMNLETSSINLSDARSRIEDADYAKEVAEMTRAQILQQAGTSVLAQANQVPQNVLSLLG
jgi:flagellin